MAGGYTAVDLSQLPAPAIVEALDYETILAEMLADLRERDPAFDALVESDPAYKVLEAAAYRELLLRQRVNEAARGVMLPYAAGPDLEILAALFGVTRLVLDPGDAEALPPVPTTLESDADLRRRLQVSLEGFSTAGPAGAYVFHALTADGEVLDATATSPSPGDVLVTVLARTGDGTASPELVALVDAALSAEDVRPLCDNVVTQGATIVPYTIEAEIFCYAGPDRAVVLAASQAAAEAYAAAQHRLGRDVTLSGIYAALHQPGVQRVELTAPTANIVIDITEASWCTDIVITDGGIDD